MMVKVSATIFILYVTNSWSAMENRPPSWLDRLVFHYKKVFLTEVSKMPAVPFQATIEKAPPGYEDSKAWDFDSVMRLLTLIQSSDNLPLRRTIHEALKPTRRLFIEPGRNRFKLFPSLAKDHIDNFYYDGVDSAEYWASDEVNVFNASDTSAIILVTNPVESRLPSARISVELLKDIMMNRAVAAREMPAKILKPNKPAPGITPKVPKLAPGNPSPTPDASEKATGASELTTGTPEQTTGATEQTTGATEQTTGAPEQASGDQKPTLNTTLNVTDKQ